ncbi:MAG: TIGR03808 family TAT-translocated repetitive protein [Hyphomicrobiaceae bacterium]|nr:TIGR03808 family TAT-translocated repetitive protein [Hyphomicrobiaceae bacterium]
MPRPLPDRRALVSTFMAGAAIMPALSGAAAAAQRGSREAGTTRAGPASPNGSGLIPDAAADQSAALQKAIDEAAIRGVPLILPPGRIRASGIKLRPGSILSGSGMRSVLISAGPGPLMFGEGAHGVRLERLVVEGDRDRDPQSMGDDGGLVEMTASRDVAIADVTITRSSGNGLVLRRCSGRVTGATITQAGAAGLLSLDAGGLAIESNRISDCASNGILVWRSTVGEDGTRVSGNRIERITARAGGSGQNGNGINVFRASGVLVTGNRITGCAYSAIRANAASNVQMVANSCERLGEVALYAEFGFEGALIAQNLVDGAASGISVTNFDEGGRLAVVQGNLIRNLRRREHEPVDKRGEGISVEADASVTGNTIEGAPTAGIVVGWGRWMREVAVTGNVIRKARVGIMVTRDPAAGTALIAQNLISGVHAGAIRLMENGLPVGEDLARTPPRSGRITVSSNAVTDEPA